MLGKDAAFITDVSPVVGVHNGIVSSASA